MTDLLPCPWCSCSMEWREIRWFTQSYDPNNPPDEMRLSGDHSKGCILKERKFSWLYNDEELEQITSAWNTRNQWQPIDPSNVKGEMLVWGGFWIGEIGDKRRNYIAHVEDLRVKNVDGYNSWIVEPTHWQPLPEPPEDG